MLFSNFQIFYNFLDFFIEKLSPPHAVHEQADGTVIVFSYL